MRINFTQHAERRWTEVKTMASDYRYAVKRGNRWLQGIEKGGDEE